MRSLKVLILPTSNKIATFLIFNRVSINSLLHASPITAIQINVILTGPIIHNGHLSSSPNKILIICFKFKISRIIWGNQFIIIYKVPAELLICFLPFTKLLKLIRDKVCEYLAEIASDSYDKTIVGYHLAVELFPCFIKVF